jgi:hypothetical protein
MKFNKEKTIQLIKDAGVIFFACLVIILTVYSTLTISDKESEAHIEYIQGNQ